MTPWIKVFIGFTFLIFGLLCFTSGLKSVAQTSWLESVVHPFTMLLICMGFSAVFQSSSLTTLILIGMVSGRVIPLEVGIAGVLGSNVGTCATGLIGSFPLDIEAKRLALSHVIFNVGAVIIAYPLLKHITWLLRVILK